MQAYQTAFICLYFLSRSYLCAYKCHVVFNHGPSFIFLMDINNNTLADLKHSFYSLKSFRIVLKEGKSKTIALYLNPQLKNKVFLRYSFLHRLEGIEERGASVFAFSHGKYFKVRLHVEVEQEKKILGEERE